MFDDAPGFIAIVTGPDHVFEFANRAYLELTSGQGIVGRSAREAMSPTEGAALLPVLDELLASPAASSPGAKTVKLAFAPGEGLPPFHIDLVCKPMIGPEGQVCGVFLEGADVTRRQLAEDRQMLLTNELSHRMKNMFASVLGLARLARSAAGDVDSFLASLATRIVAMSRTQDLITAEPGERVKLLDVLTLELAPYVGDGAVQIDLHCESMTVTAAEGVTVSLIVHELLTNALKHGALATADGRLEVVCTLSPKGAVLVWTERTSQAIRPVGAPGFGTLLTGRLIRSLGGEANFDLSPGGLVATLTFKAERVAGSRNPRSGRNPPAAPAADVSHA